MPIIKLDLRLYAFMQYVLEIYTDRIGSNEFNMNHIKDLPTTPVAKSVVS